MCLSTQLDKHLIGDLNFCRQTGKNVQFPLNNTSPTFFPSDSSRTSTNPKVNKARETINQTGEDSSNISQSLFDEIFINKRKVPQLHATGPLATLRTADAISLLTQNFQAQKIPIIDDF